MKTLKLNIYELIGNQNCVLEEDAIKVFTQLKNAIENNQRIVISFENATLITTTFLNIAIGNLYGEFGEAKIQSCLNVENMKDEDKIKLKLVTTNAKAFYSNPQQFEESIREILEG